MKRIFLSRCDCGNPDGHRGAVWHEGQPIPEGAVIGPLLERAAVVNTKPREVSFGLVTIRCGCGDPDSHNGNRGPRQVCPKPRSTADLGVAAYHNRNPLKWLAWKVGRIAVERRLRQQGELA